MAKLLALSNMIKSSTDMSMKHLQQFCGVAQSLLLAPGCIFPRLAGIFPWLTDRNFNRMKFRKKQLSELYENLDHTCAAAQALSKLPHSVVGLATGTRSVTVAYTDASGWSSDQPDAVARIGGILLQIDLEEKSLNVLESFSNEISRDSLQVLGPSGHKAADIQFLELAAALVLIKSTSFQKLSTSERIVFSIDNQSDLSALRKGRSGNDPTNLLIRAVLRATARRQIFWRWVRSANNPADLLTRSVDRNKLLRHKDPLVKIFASTLVLDSSSVAARLFDTIARERDQELKADTRDMKLLIDWYTGFYSPSDA